VATAAEADVVFVNTCAVREKAVDKLHHALGRMRRLKERRPDLRIAVGGCVAQLHGAEIVARSPHVDVLVGTHNVAGVPEMLARVEAGSGPQVDLDRKADSFTIPDAQVAHGSAVRAYVTAMEGCNHVCSFCVVPRTRGPEVCRPPAAIVAEVASVVAGGRSEVMLLGQTVNAYRFADVDFAGLLEQVHAIPGLQRLRFTTSHPEHVSERMARAWGALPRLCPYLHLPVQSGSDRVLESMRRGYTRGQYLDTIALLRTHTPGLAITSDVIVGYSGETEEEFQATVDLVDEAGFEGVFVFAYSPRPGTTAVRLPDDIPEAEKKRRVNVLNQRQQRGQAVRNRDALGSLVSVLVEAPSGPGRVMGRTPRFRIVHFDGGPELIGRTVTVEVTTTGPNSLSGSLRADP
jgi:tRNA-2-methylthio-N6-dimethylallyladenosine synthase